MIKGGSSDVHSVHIRIVLKVCKSLTVTVFRSVIVTVRRSVIVRVGRK